VRLTEQHLPPYRILELIGAVPAERDGPAVSG
jgi:hypothetical protein